MEDGYVKENQTGDTAGKQDTLRRKILGLRSKFRINPNNIGFTSGSGESQTEDSEFSSSETEDQAGAQENLEPPPQNVLEPTSGEEKTTAMDIESTNFNNPHDTTPTINAENDSDNKFSFSSSSSEDEIEMTSELEDPPGTTGIYNVNPGEETSEPSSSESEDDHTIPDDGRDSVITPTRSLSGSSQTLEDDKPSLSADPLVFPSPPNTVDGGNDSPVDNPTSEASQKDNPFSSSSANSDSENEIDNSIPLVIKGKETDDDNDLTPHALRRALEEREREKMSQENDPEHLNELGARKPSKPAAEFPTLTPTPDFMESYSPEAFDFTGDPSLRARTAFDFEVDPQVIPPSLPPKKRSVNPADIKVNRKTHDNRPNKHSRMERPEEPQPSIFHVKDKTASLGRGMWSDEDEESEPFRKNSSMPTHYPQPDRIIDFSNNPDGDHSLKRSRSDRRRHPTSKRPKGRIQSRSRSPNRSGHRVLDFPPVGNPYIDPHNGINTQAMVSLHSNKADTDAYDSVQDTGDELNNLIDKANSLGYHHNYLKPGEDIYQKVSPRERKLDSKHPEAFAKIVAPLSKPSPVPRSYRVNGHQTSDNARKSNRGQPRRYRRAPPPSEGDDETSVAESDLERLASHPHFKVPHASLPFVTEVYPRSNTEFDSYSEAESRNSKFYDRTSSFVSDGTMRDIYRPKIDAAGNYIYDARPNMETDLDDEESRAKLNPIVNSNFQICSDISGSKSFPARLREGKPKTQRPTMEHVAIPLSQASKNRQAYPTSLPYFGNEFDSDYDGLKRSGSVDDVYPIHEPSIVVHRQPLPPTGYDPDIMPAVLVQSHNYPKKEKKRKEKKEPVDKVVPQINLKVDGEQSNMNNNLQINLLPSNDPNVINLNIRSASVHQSEPQSLPVTANYTETKEPVTDMTARTQSENQHRVVDVSAPRIVSTGNNASTGFYSENGGVLLAGGVPTEIIPPPITAPSSNMPPTLTFDTSQSTQLPATHSLPVVPSPPQPAATLINTHISTPPARPVSFQGPTVVEVDAPWSVEVDNRDRSLPESGKNSDRMNRGDSGIDLTMHEGNRRSRRAHKDRRRRRSVSRSSSRRPSSVVSSDRGSKRRSSSRRHLKSHDYLGGTTPTHEYMEWYKDKHLKPSCCYLIMKHFMLIVNIIFLLVGLGLVGFGIWGMIALHQVGISDPAVITMDPLFTVMIVGLVTALVAFHGAAGFIRDNICMLKCFGALLIAIFIIFITGGITFWAMMDQVEVFVAETATTLIRQYDSKTRVGLSFLLDFIQESFHCCGMIGAGDWSNNEMFKCSPTGRCKLPASCCPKTQDSKLQCTLSSRISHQQSCNTTLANSVRNNTPIIVGGWIGVWALMMLELVFIYFMCKEVRYLQKIRKFIKNPTKYMEKAQRKSTKPDGDDEDSTSQESSEEEDSETNSSEEEYRRRRKHRRDGERKKNRDRNENIKSRGGRKERKSHHSNRSYSKHDETHFNRTRSHRDSRHKQRSRSRRRESF